jgi:hypothetical protein
MNLRWDYKGQRKLPKKKIKKDSGFLTIGPGKAVEEYYSISPAN